MEDRPPILSFVILIVALTVAGNLAGIIAMRALLRSASEDVRTGIGVLVGWIAGIVVTVMVGRAIYGEPNPEAPVQNPDFVVAAMIGAMFVIIFGAVYLIRRWQRQQADPRAGSGR